MLQADIDQLTKLATTLDTVSKDIDAIDVRTTGDKLAEALPGCQPISTACGQAGEFTEGAFLRVAQRVTALGTLINKSATTYALTDEQFRQQMEYMSYRVEGDA